MFLDSMIKVCDIMRNLDMTTLRSFVAVSDHGGVTRAAAALNLTQSAVSMQLKRLEELLGIGLLDRSARRIALTGSGKPWKRSVVALRCCMPADGCLNAARS